MASGTKKKAKGEHVTFQAVAPAEDALWGEGRVSIYISLALDARLVYIRPNSKCAFSAALKCLLRFS